MKNRYPIDVFKSAWDLLKRNKSNSIISPHEVFKELEKQEDELLDWTKGNMLFQKPNTEQLKIVEEIVNKYGLIDISKSNDADPFVIALAKDENRTVVTEEKRVKLSGPDSNPKIPNVCDMLDVNCIPILDFFRENGLKS